MIPALESDKLSAMRADVFRLDHEGEEYVVCSFPVRRPACFAELTAAELAVAEAVIDGVGTREIATLRGVSERTVSNQLRVIYEKLGVSSRLELISLVARGNDGVESCD